MSDDPDKVTFRISQRTRLQDHLVKRPLIFVADDGKVTFANPGDIIPLPVLDGIPKIEQK